MWAGLPIEDQFGRWHGGGLARPTMTSFGTANKGHGYDYGALLLLQLGPIAIRTTERAIRQYVRYALYGGSGLGIFVVTTNDINRTVEANDEPMRQDQMEDLSDTIAARTAKAKWRW
eukprot:gene1974-7424_t